MTDGQALMEFLRHRYRPSQMGTEIVNEMLAAHAAGQHRLLMQLLRKHNNNKEE